MPDAGATAADRLTCRVDAWPVFVNGLQKGENYPPGALDRMVENFGRLSGPAAEVRGVDGGPWLEAPAKLGHNARQRAKRSLGFPAFGRIARVERGPADGWLRLWLDEVPARVGGWINGRLLRSGSIELKDSIPDPRDPAKTIPGPVLTGVGFLGEEPPAVPGGGKPRAVFADGTPVPPDTDPAPLMAAIAAGEPDDATPDYSLAFSADVDPPDQEPPVTPEQIIEALAAMSPEDKAKVAAALGAPPAAPDAALSDDPAKKAAPPADAPPAYFAAFADDVKKCMSDLTTRVGAIEADGAKKMSADAEEKEKQFSAEVARVVDAAVKAGHVQPWQKAAFVTHGKSLDRTKAFSDGPAKGRTEFQDWAEKLTAGNVKAFSDQIADAPKPGAVALTAGGRAVLNTLRTTNPRVVERLTAAN